MDTIEQLQTIRAETQAQIDSAQTIIRICDALIAIARKIDTDREISTTLGTLHDMQTLAKR